MLRSVRLLSVVFVDFRMVLGRIRWFLVLWCEKRDERTIRAIWRVSATTQQQHHHPDNPAKRFLSGSSCLGRLRLFQLFRLLQFVFRFR